MDELTKDILNFLFFPKIAFGKEFLNKLFSRSDIDKSKIGVAYDK